MLIKMTFVNLKLTNIVWTDNDESGQSSDVQLVNFGLKLLMFNVICIHH